MITHHDPAVQQLALLLDAANAKLEAAANAIEDLKRQVGLLMCWGLAPFLDGELDEGLAGAFLAHLATCARCRRGLDDEAAISRRMTEIAGNPKGTTELDSASPHEGLARLGFHRIGRIDATGRRSLWLREELDAIELRAGREGGDAAVRISAEHPLYREILEVMAAARFAAEWEIESGFGLDASYELDVEPASVHRRLR